MPSSCSKSTDFSQPTTWATSHRSEVLPSPSPPPPLHFLGRCFACMSTFHGFKISRLSDKEYRDAHQPTYLSCPSSNTNPGGSCPPPIAFVPLPASFVFSMLPPAACPPVSFPCPADPSLLDSCRAEMSTRCFLVGLPDARPLRIEGILAAPTLSAAAVTSAAMLLVPCRSVDSSEKDDGSAGRTRAWPTMRGPGAAEEEEPRVEPPAGACEGGSASFACSTAFS
mmetsp:Transcript_26399/g.86761  ORF Transcript_26399/g.86761 Transcript_26399/m.86761 type:complete len:225 (+) Transcript_26399:517-1191(+)